MSRVFSLDGIAIPITDGAPQAQIFNLDCDDDECDIRVYIPGPSGPPLTDIGSFLQPVDVSTGTIAAPLWKNQRSFISAVSAPVDQPVIQNPPNNGPYLLILQCVGGNPITLNDAANIKLSGQCIFSPDTILALLWDGNSRYVEAYRNEI